MATCLGSRVVKASDRGSGLKEVSMYLMKILILYLSVGQEAPFDTGLLLNQDFGKALIYLCELWKFKLYFIQLLS